MRGVSASTVTSWPSCIGACSYLPVLSFGMLEAIQRRHEIVHEEGARRGKEGGRTPRWDAAHELPVTAKELVSASPSVTRDGATVIVGSQKSTAFLLDPVTGAVLHSFDPLAPPGGGGLSFSATSNDGNEQADGPLAECLKMAEEEGGEGMEVDGGVGFLE
ncbi:unnamed protein product, partial [Closterium sp. NIES-54]